MQVLQDFVGAHKEASDLTHVNILAELLMGAGRHAEAHAFILSQPEAGQEGGLPIDLEVCSASTSMQWKGQALLLPRVQLSQSTESVFAHIHRACGQLCLWDQAAGASLSDSTTGHCLTRQACALHGSTRVRRLSALAWQACWSGSHTMWLICLIWLLGCCCGSL